MKKIICILLSMVLIFAFAGCGDTAEDATVTAIPVGGGIGDIPLEQPSNGTAYTELDGAEYGYETEEGVETHIYYCADCDTPIITVYRWENSNDLSLEEMAKYDSEECGNGYYQVDETDDGTEFATFTSSYTDYKGAYYYVSNYLYADGDYYVEISYCNATEELQIGDTDQYLWVPTGYTEGNTQLNDGYSYQYCLTYDKSYYLPAIILTEYIADYDFEAASWADVYPDGLPFDEETYEEWDDLDWNESTYTTYYNALGFDVYSYKEIQANNLDIDLIAFGSDTYTGAELYIVIDDVPYLVSLYDSNDLDCFPWFGTVIANSIHTK